MNKNSHETGFLAAVVILKVIVINNDNPDHLLSYYCVLETLLHVSSLHVVI